MLRMRPANDVSLRFGAQLSARLDDASGWFGIADWRRWTLRLTPVAAALALATYLGLGTTIRRRRRSCDVPQSVNDWALGAAEGQADREGINVVGIRGQRRIGASRRC